jgi:hypothetical protein
MKPGIETAPNPEPDIPSPLEAQMSRWRRPLGIVLGLLTIGYAWSVVTAPIDHTQGVIQKILYVHPPLAYGAYLGFVITGFAGMVFLGRGREDLDRLAIASAEVGVIFCTLMLVTGPIWARGTWGVWWSWDARLTVTLRLSRLPAAPQFRWPEPAHRTLRRGLWRPGASPHPAELLRDRDLWKPQHAPREPETGQPWRRDGVALSAGQPRPRRGILLSAPPALGG